MAEENGESTPRVFGFKGKPKGGPLKKTFLNVVLSPRCFDFLLAFFENNPNGRRPQK